MGFVVSKKALLKFVKENPELAAKKKKRSKKQLANDKKLGRMARDRNRTNKQKAFTKSKTIKNPSKKKQQVVRPSKTRRSRGGSVSDINKSLLLGDISRMKVSKKNKMKIISSISKRLKI